MKGNFQGESGDSLDKATSLTLPNESDDEEYTEIFDDINKDVDRALMNILFEETVAGGVAPLEDGVDKKRSASVISSESGASIIGLTSTHPIDEDLDDIIKAFEDARSNSRMKETKADSIRELLQSGNSFKEIIIGLFDEFIPKKRTKRGADGEDHPTEGYGCRICQVPIKGHVCLYCEVCSTSKDKYIKDGDHICINCPQCYYKAKKLKKLVQRELVDGKCEVCEVEGGAVCKEVGVGAVTSYEEV